jgi:hypothetical protein
MDQNAPVVFKIRFGREIFTCKGHLVWEGGIVHAIVDEMPDNCPFPPDRVRLEETGRAWYQYHGFIVVS